MTATKRDIAEQMSERLGIHPDEGLKAIETILDVLADALVEGNYWEMRNFGVFKLKQRSRRMGRNIHTGEKVPVPSYRDVVFKPGKVMLERVAKAPLVVRPKLRKG
ncbi:MAG: integration host factor subunit beta [Candidatus Hydrogenedentes bacterium]|jgi:integration host factor subunit beta|nr:integration host factor subunit beta [Candidatus Hydrogenedentota bacterium]